MNGLKRTVSYILIFAFLIVSLNLYTFSSVGAVTENTQASAYSISANTFSDYRQYKADKDYKYAKDKLSVFSSNGLGEQFKKLQKKTPADFPFFVSENGAYNLQITFAPLDEVSEDYEFSLKIDGEYPFSACKKLVLSALWVDDGEIRTLTNNDEVNPLQKHKDGFYTQRVYDTDGIELFPYEFMLLEGTHTLTVEISGKEINVSDISFVPVDEIKSYGEISKSYKNFEKYSGEQIVIEAEKTKYKNSYSLSAKSDQGTASISPASPTNALINYIGGTTWNIPGSEIVWDLDVPKDGLYKLGIAFKQSYVTEGDSYRMLKIDGKAPFEEATRISFPYSNKWQFKEFSDSNGNGYLIYLEKGKHTLSLSVTLSDVAEVFSRLQEIVEPLGNLYLDIVMITGETPDKNRDYELQKQIPDFENTLKTAYKNINSLYSDMKSSLKVNGELSGALKNMSRIIKEMTDNLYEAHLYVSTFYSAQQTLSAWLYDIKNMSLAVDQIILASPDKEFDTPAANLLERIKFSLIRYGNSYLSDSNKMNSSKDKSLPKIKIWVNWGRDQARVLNSLIQDSFTTENKVNVSVEQVNATLVQGVISGNSPDLYLHMARTEPVNLAMRGVLYNLENFEDFDEVLNENYENNAEIPYVYRDGTYALPDTQNFFVMFYRKDIFEKLGLQVPVTWEDFLATTGILQRNKMNVYLPYTKLGAAGTVNIGAGGLTIFPTMLMQNGASVYTESLNATNLSSKKSISAFKFWTEFYTDYSLDQDANFYQKFRVGTIPLGIANYTQYLTLKIGAPEITGKWAIAEIPGIMQADGTVNNICSGAGTGVSVMKSSKNKDAAWKFVKWWISAETQYRYSSEVEAIIGETGRVSTANKTAASRLSWDDDSLEVILNQWDKIREIPEVPGSYYVSRSIDQAFWATKNGKKSAKESITDWSIVSDKEIQRKIKEYSGKNYGG